MWQERKEKTKQKRNTTSPSCAPTNSFLTGVESWMGGIIQANTYCFFFSLLTGQHMRAAWNLTSDTGLYVTLWTLPGTVWLYTFMNHMAITFPCHSWLTSGNYHGNPLAASSTKEIQPRYYVTWLNWVSWEALLFSPPASVSRSERRTSYAPMDPKNRTSVMNCKPRRLTPSLSWCLYLNWDLWNLEVCSLLY